VKQSAIQSTFTSGYKTAITNSHLCSVNLIDDLTTAMSTRVHSFLITSNIIKDFNGLNADLLPTRFNYKLGLVNSTVK
jgi:hypothetical protein